MKTQEQIQTVMHEGTLCVAKNGDGTFWVDIIREDDGYGYGVRVSFKELLAIHDLIEKVTV